MLEELRNYLKRLETGPVSDDGKLVSLLKEHWDALDGSRAESMSAEKLGRIENLVWEPPCITFVLERHGGTVQGSSRAELHDWTVNSEEGKAYCSTGRHHRQLRPMKPQLDVDPLAEEVAELILKHKSDERVRWNPDGSVSVVIGEILPTDSAAKQTLEGRRGRFRQALASILDDAGWRRLRVNVYRPADPR